ncbi:MAG: hypothetical protein WCR49_14555, partial [Opitutae bacterium]
LPWLLIGIAVLLIFRTRVASSRAMIALAMGPVLIALVFACGQLRWCNQLDAGLIALLVAITSAINATVIARRWWWSFVATVLLLPGLLQLAPPVRTAARHELSEVDVESLVERDLAHWLAQRTNGTALVLASPDLTASLCYHGGLRGLGTLDRENKDGLMATVMITRATSPDEALALIQKRGITHIVIPSWANMLNKYATGLSQSTGSFIDVLNRWESLVWLRPVPYHLPRIGGFEGQFVAVFEVVDEQDKADALSGLAEYFVEMGQIEQAAGMLGELNQFPRNLSAMVALAQIESARGDATALAGVYNLVVGELSRGADHALPWDRRVSLAGVLAQGNRLDLAREQTRRCFAEIDEVKLRSLSAGALFRLEAVGRKLGMEIADNRLRALGRSLLPPGARSRF